MGAWGHGPFENDTAMDFVGGLADGPADAVPDRLRTAMTVVLEADGYLESDEVEAALAAACLVTARIDASVPLDGSARKYLEELEFTPGDDLRDLASRVFVRALDPSDNEWYDVWADSGAFTKVEAAVSGYRRALAHGRS
ncbi:DUF4259 domain-containing protein [Actinomadura rubrisoli]|uniref:DUF4259 domain-containing protein n=1 Tax=Actinomadura rubrisoli TaxID=2530368 RepID=A0A4R5BAI0_9ACTN|nr:DUF4259 domain-containing protein [Actinomadura rubrisoli]TDD83398.1 DUF4259 domain-containing protein [Actinomadura rubrisoli]